MVLGVSVGGYTACAKIVYVQTRMTLNWSRTHTKVNRVIVYDLLIHLNMVITQLFDYLYACLIYINAY